MATEFDECVPVLPEGKLLEGIVTTLNDDGTPNIAPMGPIVDARFEHLLFRPFRSSVTYHNLQCRREGVLHVTDDVELFARAAIGPLVDIPELLRAEAVSGVILADTCRWYAFRVRTIDDVEERTKIVAQVVDSGRLRDFFGFNRAMHAVIEAAILATRLAWLAPAEVQAEFDRLATLVQKTGGHTEHRAFAVLREYLAEHLRPKVMASAPTTSTEHRHP